MKYDIHMVGVDAQQRVATFSNGSGEGRPLWEPGRSKTCSGWSRFLFCR